MERMISADTEVVLLLCGRFDGAKGEAPLTPSEYGRLVLWLRERQLRPADLLDATGRQALSAIAQAGLQPERVDFLLQRGTGLALSLERWARGGIWVVSRGDAGYPQRIKQRLKLKAPPLFFGAGEPALLTGGGLAIVGSRKASEAALAQTQLIARRVAEAGLSIVSGGARGVDTAALQAALEAGGRAVGVLADSLLRSANQRSNRLGLQEGRLVLLSPFHPEAGFQAGQAMARNRHIYLLADHALVIDTDLREGGTWAGAEENLKHDWVPLWVRTPGEGAGNAALLDLGSRALSAEDFAIADLRALFGVAAQQTEPMPVEAAVEDVALLGTEDVAMTATIDESADGSAGSASLPLEQPGLPLEPVSAMLPDADPAAVPVPATTLDLFPEFLQRLRQALESDERTEDELAELMLLEKAQLKSWLKRAVSCREVVRQARPVRYRLSPQASLPIASAGH